MSVDIHISVYNLGTKENPIFIVTEHIVRRELSTHKLCENCKNPIKKNSYCNFCQSKKELDFYNRKPFKEWDFVTPLVNYNSDNYFFDQEDLNEFIEEYGIRNLQLVICSENLCPLLSEEYFCEEILPENFDSLSDFDKGLVQKIKELNDYIKTLKPMSFSEGIFRTEYVPND